MAAQEPDGVTIGASPSKTDRKCEATARASSAYPALNAGWPQQVCPLGKTAVTPNLRKSLSMDSPTSGKKESTRQVPNSWTRISVSPVQAPYRRERESPPLCLPRRASVDQVGDGLVRQAASEGEPDLAGAAVRIPGSASGRQAVTERRKRRFVELREEEDPVACHAAAPRTIGDHHRFRARARHREEFLPETQLDRAARNVHGDRLRNFRELQGVQEERMDELHRLVEPQARVRFLLHRVEARARVEEHRVFPVPAACQEGRFELPALPLGLLEKPLAPERHAAAQAGHIGRVQDFVPALLEQRGV